MLVESITELSDWIDKVFSTETQVQTSNGIRWHRIDVQPTNDPVTGGSMILVNEQDIAECKQAEEKLQDRIQFE